MIKQQHKFISNPNSPKYNIYEVNKMDFNEFNTALGRATKLSDVCFNYTKKLFRQKQEPSKPTKIDFIECTKGLVYHLENKVLDLHYIGETSRTLEQRFQEHKDPEAKKLSKIHSFGNIDDWTCEKVIDVYYYDTEEIERIETRYINIYNNDYKKELINERKVPKNDIKYTLNKPVIDDKVREKYHIYETNGFIKLQWYEDGKKKEIGRRTTKNKEKAMKEIEEIKEQKVKEECGLILSFD